MNFDNHNNNSKIRNKGLNIINYLTRNLLLLVLILLFSMSIVYGVTAPVIEIQFSSPNQAGPETKMLKKYRFQAIQFL